MDFVHPRFSALGRNEYAQRRNEAVSVIYDADQKECPYCHSRSIIRNGHVKSNHRSRYYCKDCHHSFVSSINTIYYRGRLGQHEVRSLLDSLVVDTTVIGAAKETNVSKNTSLRYRHMLLGYVEKPIKSLFCQVKECRSMRPTRHLAEWWGTRKRRRESHPRRKPYA